MHEKKEKPLAEADKDNVETHKEEKVAKLRAEHIRLAVRKEFLKSMKKSLVLCGDYAAIRLLLDAVAALFLFGLLLLCSMIFTVMSSHCEC